MINKNACRPIKAQEFYGNEQPSFQEQRFVIKGKGTVIPDVKSARGLELQYAGTGISEPG